MALLLGAFGEAGQAGHELGTAVLEVADAGVYGVFHAYRVKNIL